MSQLIIHVVRVAVGLIFVYAGLTKLGDPPQFLRDLYAYQMLGPPLGRYVAAWLPFVEVLAGTCLLTGLAARAAALLVAALAGIFIVAQAFVIAKGLVVPCRCFGDSATIGLGSVVRVGLVGGCGCLLASQTDWPSRDDLPGDASAA